MPRKRKSKENWRSRQVYEDDVINAIGAGWSNSDAEGTLTAESEENLSTNKKEPPLSIPTVSLASKERQG